MVQIGQGRILTWDPETLENTVDVKGALLTNLPIVHDSVTGALEVLDRVALMKNDSADDQSWWIVGKLIVPSAGGG